MFLTERDKEIVLTLTRRVKVLTVPQLHRTWWAASKRPADLKRRLATLEAAGLVRRTTLLAKDERPLERPLAVWRPAEARPDLGAVVRVARGRWRTFPTPVQAIIASDRAAALFGGAARVSRPSEHTHDLHLSHVYLRLRDVEPRLARAWVGEGEIVLERGASESGVVPDAVIRLPGRSIVVEVVGESYTEEKLCDLHEHCVECELQYELW